MKISQRYFTEIILQKPQIPAHVYNGQVFLSILLNLSKLLEKTAKK